MRIGIGLPNGIPGTDGQLIVAWSRLADKGPFSSLGVVDRLVYDSYDPFAALAAAAAVTQRIRLATTIIAGPIHSTAMLAKKAASLDDARRMAEEKLVDGSGYKKFKQVVAAQGGNPQALDKFELLPNATGMREVTSPRGGYVSAIDAEDIGVASNMIGAGRDRKEDTIDPAVGIILEVKVGEKVDAGSVLCRLYYTREDRVEEAAEMVEDAFKISGQKPEERELILEVVG